MLGISLGFSNSGSWGFGVSCSVSCFWASGSLGFGFSAKAFLIALVGI